MARQTYGDDSSASEVDVLARLPAGQQASRAGGYSAGSDADQDDIMSSQGRGDMTNHMYDGPRSGTPFGGSQMYGTGRGDSVNDMMNGDLTNHPMDC